MGRRELGGSSGGSWGLVLWAVAVAVASVRAGAAASARCSSPLRAPGQPRTAAPWRRQRTRAARPRRTRAASCGGIWLTERGGCAPGAVAVLFLADGSESGGGSSAAPACPKRERAIFSWATWFFAGGAGRAPQCGARGDRAGADRRGLADGGELRLVVLVGHPTSMVGAVLQAIWRDANHLSCDRVDSGGAAFPHRRRRGRSGAQPRYLGGRRRGAIPPALISQVNSPDAVWGGADVAIAHGPLGSEIRGRAELHQLGCGVHRALRAPHLRHALRSYPVARR